MATYYIDPTGVNDAGRNGGVGQEWASLDYACTRVVTIGDIICVNAGTYYATVQALLALGVYITGAGDTSLIIASAGLEPIIKLASASEGTLGNQSVSYIKIDGNATGKIGIASYARSNVSFHHVSFTNFYNATGLAYGLFITGRVSGDGDPTTPATGIQVYNCNFDDCAGDYYSAPYYFAGSAISIGGTTDALVYNNHIDESTGGRHGYGIKTASSGYNRGLRIFDNYIKTSVTRGVTNSWAFSIETWNSKGGMQILRNTIINGGLDLAGGGNSDEAGYGFALWVCENDISWDVFNDYWEKAILFEGSTTGGAYIEKNYIRNVCIGIGFSLQNGQIIDGLYVNRNVFFDITRSSGAYTGRITQFGIASGTATFTNMYYDNNTVKNSTYIGSSAFHFNVVGAIFSNIGIRNNIIDNFYYPVRFENSNVDTVNYENNNCHDNHQNTITYYNCTGTNVTEQNNQAITVDPLFISASDFHLQGTSPCINAGINVGLPFRGSAPDMGAFEYYVGKRRTATTLWSSVNLKTASSYPRQMDIEAGTDYIDCKNLELTHLRSILGGSTNHLSDLANLAGTFVAGGESGKINAWARYKPGQTTYVTALPSACDSNPTFTYTAPGTAAAVLGDFAGYYHLEDTVPTYWGAPHDTANTYVVWDTWDIVGGLSRGRLCPILSSDPEDETYWSHIRVQTWLKEDSGTYSLVSTSALYDFGADPAPTLYTMGSHSETIGHTYTLCLRPVYVNPTDDTTPEAVIEGGVEILTYRMWGTAQDIEDSFSTTLNSITSYDLGGGWLHMRVDYDFDLNNLTTHAMDCDVRLRFEDNSAMWQFDYSLGTAVHINASSYVNFANTDVEITTDIVDDGTCTVYVQVSFDSGANWITVGTLATDLPCYNNI